MKSWIGLRGVRLVDRASSHQPSVAVSSWMLRLRRSPIRRGYPPDREQRVHFTSYPRGGGSGTDAEDEQPNFGLACGTIPPDTASLPVYVCSCPLCAEILSDSRARGLFAGVSLEGTFVPIDEATEQVYGRKITARTIVTGKRITVPASGRHLVDVPGTSSVSSLFSRLSRARCLCLRKRRSKRAPRIRRTPWRCRFRTFGPGACGSPPEVDATWEGFSDPLSGWPPLSNG